MMIIYFLGEFDFSTRLNIEQIKTRALMLLTAAQRVRSLVYSVYHRYTECPTPTRFYPDSTLATAQQRYPQTPRFSDSLDSKSLCGSERI